MRVAFTRCCLHAAAFFAVLSISSLASANGRYPAAGLIALHPADPSTILVRATYGVLLTKNAGQRWEWICEGAIGFGGSEDPMVSFTADGTILAGIFEGLSVSRNAGCQWGFVGSGIVGSDIIGRYVVDLSVERTDPKNGVLIVSNSAGQDDAGAPVYLVQLWGTEDNGQTWAQSGTNLPDQFLGLTVDTAPSDRNRVYLSGRYGPPDYMGVLQRSDDRGATWQKLPISGSNDTHLPYVSAIDPNNPDVVYVRLDGDPSDQLVVTKDGGTTWIKVFEGVGDLLGFALSPDGNMVAIGGDKDGLWTAPASTLQFTKASKVGAKCLTWAAADTLYACADEFVDGFTAGVSADFGKTFTPIMHLHDLCGPLACDPGSSVEAECTAAWAKTSMDIAAEPCDGVDAGPGGGSASSSSGGGVSGSKGCSCALPGTAAGGFASAASLLGAAALLARRRGRRYT